MKALEIERKMIRERRNMKSKGRDIINIDSMIKLIFGNIEKKVH